MTYQSVTNPANAHSIEQMQQVASNQIQHKIWELEERVQQLKTIKSQVETVTDWDSYQALIGNIDVDDSDALTALNILGNEGQTMINGDYF